MAPKGFVLPPLDELAELAAKASSQADLARALGWEQSTLSKKLNLPENVEAKALVERALNGMPARPDGEEPAISTEEIQQQRIAELETEARKRRKADVFAERVSMAITDAIERRGPTFSPQVIPKASRPGQADHEFVLLWSDTHFGEVVSKEETNGLNEYDAKICWKRHEKMRESIFSYADNRPYPVDKLHIAALGDMLSGNIHDELAETNEIPLAESSVAFAYDGSAWLRSVAERFRQIEFAGVVGNHPRFSPKMRAKQAFDNADWFTYHQMALHLRDDERFKFTIPRSNAHVHQVIGGRNLLLWHGDGVRSSMPGVPWGGVTRRAAQLQNQYTQAGSAIYAFLVGHFHQRNIVAGPANSYIAMNGSPKGVDEYSLKAFGGGQHPCQLLLTFHKTRGLTDASFLDL